MAEWPGIMVMEGDHIEAAVGVVDTVVVDTIIRRQATAITQDQAEPMATHNKANIIILEATGRTTIGRLMIDLE